jgi:hypothetical protein
LQLGLNIQPRHQPIENIRSRQLVSYPFILLSIYFIIHGDTKHVILWENSRAITTNNRHGQRRCLEAWHIINNYE